MAKHLNRWWIPTAAFLVAALLALLAGPSMAASGRAFMSYTGKRYFCLRYCEPGGEPSEMKSSARDMTGENGWECTEENPVNFFTGANFYSTRDLQAQGLGRFSVTRMYLQDPDWADHSMGPGWRIGWFYRLVPNGQQIWMIGGTHPIVTFTSNGNGTYTPDFDYVQTLTQDSINHLLILTDSKGKRWTFFDLSGAWSPARQGRLKEFQDRGGNLTTIVYGSSGVTLDKVLEVQQTDTDPSLLHRFVFGYNLSGASVGLLATITYTQSVGGVPATVRAANYSYYASSGPNGPAGTLQRVRITDGAATLDTLYYRYDPLQGTGFLPMRYAVHPKAYARLSSALGSDAAIDAAPDSTIALYADYHFVYDAARRVIQETVLGEGCNCGTSGSRGVFTYSYQIASHGQPDGPNVWRNKCVVTLPDGNQRLVYTNGVGQTMLDVTKEVATGNQWRKYFVFNPDHSQASVTFPSGVTGHDETTASLVTAAHLPPSTGLWHLFQYHATTNIPAGAVAGYASAKLVRQGASGTPILQESYLYTSRMGASGTIYPMSQLTLYRNAGGTGAQPTTFGYTWQGTTTQILQLTTTYPVVTVAQNGSGTATTTTSQYDAFGRETWFRDGDGYIQSAEYSTLTGSVVRQIIDVDTATATNEPAGWTTPAGGGLHQVTAMEVDRLGRVTKLTDAGGSVSYTVYRDPQFETRVYPGWVPATNTPTGPTQLTRHDRAGNYVERLTMSAAPAVAGGVPTGIETIASLQSLHRSYMDNGDRVSYQDSYFNLAGLVYSTAPHLGSPSNYHRRTFNFDARGRLDRDLDWSGTVRRIVYDVRDRVASTWIGTDDTPTLGEWSPLNLAGTNLIQVKGNEYDLGTVGDDNLTRISTFTSAVASLDIHLRYDFRNRLTVQRGADLVARAITYDNLDHAVLVDTFADANSNLLAEASELRGREESRFDEKSQVYQTVSHQVDPTTGVVGNRLTLNHWFNARGLSIKSRGPNGQFQKAVYNGAREFRVGFLSYDDAESTYAQASDAVGDTVVEQMVRDYDAKGNVILTAMYFRTPGTAKTGDLSVSWAVADSRRTYVAHWYDTANRKIRAVDYGTNGNAALVRPATPPAPNTSDNRLTIQWEYDAAGRQHRTVDNLGRVHVSTFDALSRQIRQVENFVGTGTVAETDLGQNRTTAFEYDSAGRLFRRVAYNPKGAGAGVEQQVTRYIYGTDANAAAPPIWRNDLPVAEIAADSDDTYNPAGTAGAKLGNGADGVYDRVEFTYQYAGRRATMRDPRGVIRTFAYDSAGRLLSDAVTTLPSGVDGAVRRLQNAYDSLSRLATMTSYTAASGGSVVNQVRHAYDGWGNLIRDEQAHVGSVIAGTPSVQKSFADGAAGGEAAYVRPSSLTYPNGRVLHATYPASGAGFKLSRPQYLANDAAGTTRFAQYQYLGQGAFLDIQHPLVTNGLLWRTGTNGSPAAWDRFGRTLETRWRNTANTFTHDLSSHRYDRRSNRLTRDVAPTTAPPAAQDEYYTYDGLNRLTKMVRGSLTGSPLTIADAASTFYQDWAALESQGNWRSFRWDNDGGAVGGLTLTDQARKHNAANEIDNDASDANAPVATITGTGADWIDPVFDKAGNLKNGPRPGAEATRIHLVHDAWNRQVRVSADNAGSPGTTIAEYQYDAQHRRIVKLKPNGVNWDRVDYLYSPEWQILEERSLTNVASKSTVATVPKFQWIWDLRHSDAVALRDENKDGDGDCVDGSDQRLFYMQDANLNTTGLVDVSGNVVERYVYDPYGRTSVLSGAWAAQSPNLFANEVTYGGYRSDPETGLFHVRNRNLHFGLGRWTSRDPMKFVDGSNLYEYATSTPPNGIDPMGTDFIAVGFFKVFALPIIGPTFGHMSLELYKECPDQTKEKTRFDPTKPPNGAVKEAEMELLNQIPLFNDWGVIWGHWSSVPAGKGDRRWVWFGDWVSVIQRSSLSTLSTVIYAEDDSREKWMIMDCMSWAYPYAEQSWFTIGMWPQSQYDWFGNNSNTFVREMASSIPREPLDYVGDLGTFPGNFPARPVRDPGYTPMRTVDANKNKPTANPRNFNGPFPNR